MNIGHVIATKMLIEKKLPVRFMYRESGTDANDSGWRFFSGYEDQNYVDNPDNLGIYDISTILEIDNSVLPYLDSKIGMAFEKNDASGVFVVSKDFGFAPEEV